jgi:putative transposase
MILVERHIIKNTHNFYKECDQLSFLSKNLYNKANYIIRQKFIETSKQKEKGEVEHATYLNYYDINRLMIKENDVDYIALPRKVSNGVLRLLDKNWRGFFQSIKDWKKNPDKYLGRPKLPKYKDKQKGRNIVIYEKGAISKTDMIKNKEVKLSKTNIKIKTDIEYEDVQSVRIVPRYGHYVVEIIYNKEIVDHYLNKEKILGIDLGLNNLATMVSNKKEDVKIIINGKPLKSINQFYNKRKSKLQSLLKEKRKTSNQIEKLTNKRNNKINDYLHKTSRYIIDYCLTNSIGKIIIGKNKEWKQSINIGKRNNQNFVSIPFDMLIQQIIYKGILVGVDVETTEESYTSKCSFIDNESLQKHDTYKGKRIKRGLFRSKDDILLNADINGAFNIIRKVVPTFNIVEYGIEDVAVHPMKVVIFS